MRRVACAVLALSFLLQGCGYGYMFVDSSVKHSVAMDLAVSKITLAEVDAGTASIMNALEVLRQNTLGMQWRYDYLTGKGLGPFPEGYLLPDSE